MSIFAAFMETNKLGLSLFNDIVQYTNRINNKTLIEYKYNNSYYLAKLKTHYINDEKIIKLYYIQI